MTPQATFHCRSGPKPYWTRIVSMTMALAVLAAIVTFSPPSAPAAAAPCGPVCQLFNGSAHLEPDTRFVPPAAMTNHLETSTVFFGGRWRMYYRTFKYRDAVGIGECPFPTGIGLAMSTDGDRWSSYNGGLPLPGLATQPACPPSARAASAWLYAPDVEVDGSMLRMAFEVRRTYADGGRNYHRIDVASSSDGRHWGSQRTIVSSGAVGSWKSEVGTPDLLRRGSAWAVLFHANGSGHFVRAMVTGGPSFGDAFSGTRIVIGGQAPQQHPRVSWYDFGPGLGDVISEGGTSYQLMEGFSGSGVCGQNLSTPRVGLARSADLIRWQVSSGSPAQEIGQVGTSCGHDMANWQVRPNGEPTVVTTNDPPDGTAPVRWRIVAGAPLPQPLTPPDRLAPNQFLAPGQGLATGNGYTLVMQGDGNLVLVAPGNQPTWATGTDGHPGAIAVMQGDGNVVVVGPGNQPLWATGTNGHPGAVLVLQTDGNLVVYGPGGVALWATGTGPPPPPPRDRLNPGEQLASGEALRTTNGYVLVMQGDGNLVLVAPGNRPIWATGTNGRVGAIAAMQGDGNFVVIGPGNQPLWATGTNGHPGAVLVLQTDANLVVYGPGSVPLWASGTVGL